MIPDKDKRARALAADERIRSRMVERERVAIDAGARTLGSTEPAEGSVRRAEVRRRAELILERLQEFGRQEIYPLLTRPTMDPELALLCADCGWIFEPGEEAGHTRNDCPRCASTTNVKFIPKPKLGDEEQSAATEQVDRDLLELSLALDTLEEEGVRTDDAMAALSRIAAALGRVPRGTSTG